MIGEKDLLRREGKKDLPETEDPIWEVRSQEKPTGAGPSGKGVDIQPAEPRSVENKRTRESENALKGWKEEETISVNALTARYAQHRHRTMRDPEYAASLTRAIAFEPGPHTVRIMDLGAPPDRNKSRASDYESALENYLKHLKRKTRISLSVMTLSLLALWFASIIWLYSPPQERASSPIPCSAHS